MIINAVSLKKDSSVDITFGIIQKGNDLGLLMIITGEYGIGSCGNDNGNYIGSMLSAALYRWRVRYLVLDFSNMVYEMSDSLGKISDVIKKNRSPNYLTFIIVSQKCKISVLSLVNRLGSKWTVKIITNISEIYSAQQGDAPGLASPAR
jgi:hypothetical protein